MRVIRKWKCSLHLPYYWLPQVLLKLYDAMTTARSLASGSMMSSISPTSSILIVRQHLIDADGSGSTAYEGEGAVVVQRRESQVHMRSLRDVFIVDSLALELAKRRWVRFDKNSGACHHAWMSNVYRVGDMFDWERTDTKNRLLSKLNVENVGRGSQSRTLVARWLNTKHHLHKSVSLYTMVGIAWRQ